MRRVHLGIFRLLLLCLLLSQLFRYERGHQHALVVGGDECDGVQSLECRLRLLQKVCFVELFALCV